MSSEEYFWYPARVTIYKEHKTGNWVQALVRHRKTTGPGGTRLQILKKLQTIMVDK